LLLKRFDCLEIIEKINSNAYQLKLSSHIKTSNVFNVKHLLPYMEDLFDEEVKFKGESSTT
jgi:hypothetical protein